MVTIAVAAQAGWLLNLSLSASGGIVAVTTSAREAIEVTGRALGCPDCYRQWSFSCTVGSRLSRIARMGVSGVQRRIRTVAWINDFCGR